MADPPVLIAKLPGTPRSPTASIPLRDAAAYFGMSVWSLKRALLAQERATGERFTIRRSPRGKLYTTVALCKAALGGAPTPGEDAWRDRVEQRLDGLRRDLNALAHRVRRALEHG